MAAVIYHGNYANGVTTHQGEGFNLLGAKDKHIQGVLIVTVGTGDKAVICRVVGRGIQDAVQHDKAGFLIQLVLFLAALFNFHNSNKIVRGNPFGVNIMPNIHSYPSLC